MTDTVAADRHRIERVRHETKRRLLTASRVERLTPAMVRVTLTGDDLAGFVSLGYDDHVKLFFPLPGEKTPTFASEDGPPPVMRDYTPRAYDPDRNELVVDFAIHDAGPATAWASSAKPGDKLGVGGPRGSFVVADDFDWYLLVGDETALPAIGRRLAELRAGARAFVIGEVSDAGEEQDFDSAAHLSVTWVHRGDAEPGTTELLDAAVRAFSPPAGDGYAWVACEAAGARRLRRILVEEKHHPKAWLKAASYWTRGKSDVHETLGDDS